MRIVGFLVGAKASIRDRRSRTNAQAGNQTGSRKVRSQKGWWLAVFTTESTENTEIGKEEGVRIGQKRTLPFPIRLCGLCDLCGEIANFDPGLRCWLAPENLRHNAIELVERSVVDLDVAAARTGLYQLDPRREGPLQA